MTLQYEVEIGYLDSKRAYRTLTGIFSTLQKAQESFNNPALEWVSDFANCQWHSWSGSLKDDTLVYFIITEAITEEHKPLLSSLADGRPQRLEYARQVLVQQLVNDSLISMEQTITGTWYRITTKGKLITKPAHHALESMEE
jgi:hypothetical protein